MRAEVNGGPPRAADAHDWSTGAPERAEFVAGMMDAFGKSPEHWAAEWDAMNKGG